VFVRRLLAVIVVGLLVIGAVILVTPMRGQLRAILRPEPPAPITPIALSPSATLPLPTALPSPTVPAPTAAPSAPPRASAAPAPTALPSATMPAPSATPGPVTVNGRVYDAYIPAASKEGQFFQYSCEFDAAWVVLASFGYEVSMDELLASIGVDDRVEPYIEETGGGFIIHGGDIGSRFSGDYRTNFLARSTGAAFRPVFESYGLRVEPVSDRAGVEAALRRGALVWMKTTVDFKPWRPATWRTPEGAEFQTVLGNDHAVVAIGFNQEAVVIRDVLGPTSSNWERPYEYEVSWETFLASWGAQSFDGLAVERAPLAAVASSTTAPSADPSPSPNPSPTPTPAPAAALQYSYPVGIPGRPLGDGFVIGHGAGVENTWYAPGNWHTGEDWYLLEGDTGGAQVFAVAAGQVVYAGANYPGRVVIVRHDDGLYAMYGHLDPALAVALDERVGRGQLLGTVLTQRNARAPSHLHFEIREFLTAREVNGSAPRYSYNCGVNCPPGPGYWPIDAPDLPADQGWANPTHTIARRMLAPGAGEPLGSVVVASRPVSTTLPLWSGPPDDAARQELGDIGLEPGAILPLLGVWAGDEQPRATSATAYQLWYRLALADGREGWLQAVVPLAIETGADGRPSSVGFNLFPATEPARAPRRRGAPRPARSRRPLARARAGRCEPSSRLGRRSAGAAP
jgi:murein DD-endopeptidase MepM/ murein hydrolase activator NlpD